jgi:hypothetical protein
VSVQNFASVEALSRSLYYSLSCPRGCAGAADEMKTRRLKSRVLNAPETENPPQQPWRNKKTSSLLLLLHIVCVLVVVWPLSPAILHRPRAESELAAARCGYLSYDLSRAATWLRPLSGSLIKTGWSVSARPLFHPPPPLALDHDTTQIFPRRALQFGPDVASTRRRSHF